MINVPAQLLGVIVTLIVLAIDMLVVEIVVRQKSVRVILVLLQDIG